MISPAKIESASRICFQVKLRIGSGRFTFANFMSAIDPPTMSPKSAT